MEEIFNNDAAPKLVYNDKCGDEIFQKAKEEYCKAYIELLSLLTSGE